MAESGNTACISLDFGHNSSDGNGNIILERRKTEIVNIIATDIGNNKS